MTAYLDASVLVPRFVEEPDSTVVDTYLADISEELLISDFAAAEAASAVSRLVRMGLLGVTEADAALRDFEIWRATAASPAELHPADARLAYAYVQRFELKLRAPDALHLAIARRLGATMITLDGRLADAARDLGVAVAVLGADNPPDPA